MFHKAGIKVHYKLSLQSVSGVTPSTPVQISYKRGAKKENHGEFPQLTSNSEGVATFKNATIELNCTLFKDSTLFEAKSIVFTLKEVQFFFSFPFFLYFIRFFLLQHIFHFIHHFIF